MEQQSDVSVSLSYDGSDYDRVKAFYEDWIDASGFGVVNKFETSAPKSISWGLEDGDASYNITMSGASEETFVSLFVTGS
jgi:hypothetical protein